MEGSLKRKKHNTKDDEDPAILEQRHFQHVVDAFMFYHTSSMRQVEQKIKTIQKLSLPQQSMLANSQSRLIEMSAAIDVNYDFIKLIVQCTKGMFTNSDVSANANRDVLRPLSGDDISRVRTTIRQCVRDWSNEGKEERKLTYAPILKELDDLFPKDLFERGSVSVLVPGAGLGRLMFEIANQGFTCQGNEFSLYMLFASNYILNICTEAYSIPLHPWVHQTCNIFSKSGQIQEIKIPDVNPQQLNNDCEFSMAAGDFLEVYDEDESWDCVAMCFFLDTAHNALDYIQKVYNILKPGGYWINLGPLLWHFADIPGEPSIELTYEEIREIILNQFKFTLVKEKTGVTSTYVGNPNSMFKMHYENVFFVVQKPFVEN